MAVIYTSVVAPSPKGEGWDEGKYNYLILTSSAHRSAAPASMQVVQQEGSKVVLQLIVFNI